MQTTTNTTKQGSKNKQRTGKKDTKKRIIGNMQMDGQRKLSSLSFNQPTLQHKTFWNTKVYMGESHEQQNNITHENTNL